MGGALKYYTYSHSTPDGVVFYIGKGCDGRAYSFGDRGWEWRECVAKAKGILIKIVAEWQTEAEAFIHEKALIKYYKELGFKLANLTDGGSGPTGYMLSVATRGKLSKANKGRVFSIITCPHCNKSGGATSMKRWHFERCAGNRQYKARISYELKRVFLGNFTTKEEANQRCVDFYASVNKPLPKEFIRHSGITNMNSLVL